MGVAARFRESDRILLVDDESDLTNLWRQILETTGRYTVQEENCGSLVMQTARKFRPHLIFIDRQLGVTDGGVIAAELRRDHELGSVPIVFITGSVTPEAAALHGLFGGMPTLAKPFRSEILARLAGVVLDRHRRPWLSKCDQGGYSAQSARNGQRNCFTTLDKD